MKNFAIFFENKKTRTLLNLDVSNGKRVIEELTTYLRENGEINKTESRREVYNTDIDLNKLKLFFNSQLQAITEFYRVRGEFNIEIKII